MGFIKKLIGGIFAFLGGLLKGLKKSEYFLELNESKDSQPATSTSSATSTPAKATAKAAAKAKSAKVESPPVEPAKTSTNGKVDQVASVKAAQPVAAAAKSPEPVSQPATPAQSQFEPTFAPKFLLHTSQNGRRRPGPSMNVFLDMAKQVKA